MSKEYLVETSIWIKREFGSKPERDQIEQIQRASCFYASRYIRMEVHRRILRTLAEIYLLVHNEISTAEALRQVARKFSFRPRKLITADYLLAQLLEQGSLSNDVREVKFQIRQYLIQMKRRLLKEGTLLYIDDAIGCPLAQLDLQIVGDESTQLHHFRQYIERFERENKNPTCRLRGFLNTHQATLQQFVTPEVRNNREHRRNKGFFSLSPTFKKLLTGQFKLKCFTLCAQLGDTVISLELPRDKTLLTTDRAFSSLCGIQGKSAEFLDEV
jgi:hypothetical protein